MRRRYSDREKAEALAAFDTCGNLTETSRMTGIPDSTLSQWVNGSVGVNDDIPLMRDFKKLDLASKLESIAHQCAGLLPERLPEANVREIVGAMGQSIEKSQLLRGRPTSITETKEFAKQTAREVQAKYGLSEDDANQIIAQEFGDILTTDSVS